MCFEFQNMKDEIQSHTMGITLPLKKNTKKLDHVHTKSNSNHK